MGKIPVGHGQFALVDDQDVIWLCLYGSWCLNDKGRPQSAGIGKGRKCRHMSVIIAERMGLDTKHYMVDHKDGNLLNNQRHNLRQATRAQNGANREGNKTNPSGHKGVSFYQGKWSVRITIDGKEKYLGRYSTVKEAAEVYDAASKIHHGEFALCNRETM